MNAAAVSIQAENNDFIISHFVCVYNTNDVTNYLSIDSSSLELGDFGTS